MAAHYTNKQLEEIHSLREQGMSYKDIAIKYNRVNNKGQPNSRSVMEAYAKWLKTKPQQPQQKEEVPQKALLNEMTRRQRYEHLTAKMGSTPRTKYLFETYNNEEKAIFIDEYDGIIREMESLTAAEEQQLFLALNNFVLAMRAQKRDKVAWDKHESSLKPVTPGALPQRIEPYDTRFTAEYDDRMTQYINGIKALKMSREQRLKDIAKSGNTFLDFAELLAKKENQLGISEEILSIEHKTEEELKRLQTNGWIIFGKSESNNFDVKYEP